MIARWAALLLLALGCFWAYERGANDFSVFYEAWRLVLQGQGNLIYHSSPDRFLYAPGFAWILSPLSLLPKSWALAVWCLAKYGVGIWMIWTLGPWGLLLAARPLLIDFQYGQVNFLILGACLWGMQMYFAPYRRHWSAISWFVLSVAAAAKIFPLPLLLLPWLRPLGEPNKRRALRVGSLLGLLLILLIPVFSFGISGTIQLMSYWKEALIARGLPMESHNQSFSAFLHHYLSGNTTHIIAQAAERRFFLGFSLSDFWLSAVSYAWIFGVMVVLLYFILRAQVAAVQRWTAIILGGLIVPSHLIWKPYFVFSIPLLAWAAANTHSLRIRFVLLLSFTMLNLTGFDFVGRDWGGRLEAASLMLWAHLALIYFATFYQAQRT